MIATQNFLRYSFF